MGHPARRRRPKSKPLVTSTLKKSKTTMDAMTVADAWKDVPEAASQPVQQVPVPQQDLMPHAPPTGRGPLAGPLTSLDLSDSEWDSLFCLAVRHHFEQEKVWVPSVLRTMPLLEGINDRTGRPCRIYIRPNRRVLIVETLS